MSRVRQALLSGPPDRGRALGLPRAGCWGVAELPSQGEWGGQPGGVRGLRALGGRAERLGPAFRWPLLVRMGLGLVLGEGDRVGCVGRSAS